MSDFIFGTLATDELRRARVDGLRSGVTHNHRRTPRDPSPDQPVELLLRVGPLQPGDRAWVYWTNDGEDPLGQAGVAIHGFVTEMESFEEDWDTVLWGYGRGYRAVLPGQPAGTLLRYRLSAYSEPQGEVFADQGAYYAVYIDHDPPPEWAAEAVVYQIFVDRFNPGKGKSWLRPASLGGFYGGTLQGVTEKLSDLAELGFNAVWLTPVFPSPSHHGYDATDFNEIEPRLGSIEDLKRLIDEAHQYGIRVILDIVPNHCSNLHPYFQDAILKADSPYREWFTFEKWPDHYASFFSVASLPQINLRCEDARNYVIAAACRWLEMGVDGFRVDYAIGPAPDFWAEFRRATRAVRPDCWTFGEVVDPPDAQLSFEGGLDGCLDFILLEALRQSFAFGRWNAVRLADFLNRHEAYFPRTFSRPSFLDNHDMNRFLWAAGNDQRRLKLAAMCQFTLAGSPIVYYGTEVGLSQERDVRQGALGIPEESRQPMLWDSTQDAALKEFYRSLIQLRRRNPEILHGQRVTLFADPDLLVYAYSGQTGSLVTVLNLSQRSRQYPQGSGSVTLLLSSDEQVILSEWAGGEKVILDLPPISGAVYRVNGSM